MPRRAAGLFSGAAGRSGKARAHQQPWLQPSASPEPILANSLVFADSASVSPTLGIHCAYAVVAHSVLPGQRSLKGNIQELASCTLAREAAVSVLAGFNGSFLPTQVDTKKI